MRGPADIRLNEQERNPTLEEPMKSRYELSVLAHGRRIAWETDSPQTAYKWFRFTVETGRTIDSGEQVTLVALTCNGAEIKSAAIG
jgi:hypothetical protein